MKTKMMTMALLVVAVMGASMSASAQSRKSGWSKERKSDVRKEIRFCKCKCPCCAKFSRMTVMVPMDIREARLLEQQRKDIRFMKGAKRHKHIRRTPQRK